MGEINHILKSLEKAAFGQTYKTVWCAGQSIKDVHEIKPISKIVESIIEKY